MTSIVYRVLYDQTVTKFIEACIRIHTRARFITYGGTLVYMDGVPRFIYARSDVGWREMIERER